MHGRNTHEISLRKGCDFMLLDLSEVSLIMVNVGAKRMGVGKEVVVLHVDLVLN